MDWTWTEIVKGAVLILGAAGGGGIVTIVTQYFAHRRSMSGDYQTQSTEFRENFKVIVSDLRIQIKDSLTRIAELEHAEAECRKKQEEMKHEHAEQTSAFTEELSRLHSTVATLITKSFTATVISDANGKIVTWSSEAAALFKYTREEITGESVSRLIAPFMRQRHDDAMAATELSPHQPTVNARINDGIGIDKFGEQFPVYVEVNSFFIGEQNDKLYHAKITRR